jgi:hypothetical protein
VTAPRDYSKTAEPASEILANLIQVLGPETPAEFRGALETARKKAKDAERELYNVDWELNLHPEAKGTYRNERINTLWGALKDAEEKLVAQEAEGRRLREALEYLVTFAPQKGDPGSLYIQALHRARELLGGAALSGSSETQP